MRSGAMEADERAGRVRRKAVFLTWLANLPIAFLIGTSYLVYVPETESVRLWLFAHLGLLSALATMALAPLALLLLLGRWLRSPRGFGVANSVAWMFFHVFLYTDTRVYNLFRYHLGGSAWNLLTTPGSRDSFHLGAPVWIRGFLLGGLFFAAEMVLWRVAVGRARRGTGGSGWRLLLRPSVLALILLLSAMTVEKSIYAQADLVGDREVARVSQVFPMYPRVTVEPLLPEKVLAQWESVPPVPVRLEDAVLDYPRVVPSLDPDGPRPNILLLVLEAWRWDAFDPEVTPELCRFAAEARCFEDHLSAGNQTRFGIFALLYGLHGSYWWPVLEARRSPVLIDALIGEGYELRALASASMSYPELRSTAWVGMSDCVEDQFQGKRSHRRDRQLTQSLLEWWRARRGSERPFFAFALLDASHPSYDFPADAAPFRPYAEELDYVAMSDPEKSRDPQVARLVKNRYLNALHHSDSLVGRLLEDLRRSGELENTIVIVTGDHGQEFGEHGHWGHTSNFAPVQVRVPFLMSGPGIEPGRETRPTSHLDVACTLLELMGADPADRPGYTLGQSLLEPIEGRNRAVAGWSEMGLWTDRGIFRIPMDEHRGFEVGVCDYDWEPLLDVDPAFEAMGGELERLSAECSRFLLRAGS